MIIQTLVLLPAALLAFGLSSCSLESSSEGNCSPEPDQTLLDTPPADTAYVSIESPDPDFNRNFRGIRIMTAAEDPVNGIFGNVSSFERSRTTGRLLGLGTQVLDTVDSARVILIFNQGDETYLDDICRSSKIFQREHDWSKWEEDIAGVEIILIIPIGNEMVTFSTDTSQEDDNTFNLDGAAFLDDVGFYARLSGFFNTTLSEVGLVEPREAEVTGSFTLNMRLSR